jgi:hypothetical protein
MRSGTEKNMLPELNSSMREYWSSTLVIGSPSTLQKESIGLKTRTGKSTLPSTT